MAYFLPVTFVQVPVMAVLHTPVTRQVTVGLPLYPSLQLPVQVAPTLLGVVQLNTPLDRVGGWPVHLTGAQLPETAHVPFNWHVARGVPVKPALHQCSQR